MWMPYCLTYFYVEIGSPEFDLADFCERLGLDYEMTERFSTEDSMDLGRCEEFDPDINVSVRKTLDCFFGKEDILVELSEKYSLKYYLERVPIASSEEGYPYQRWSLDDDIIEFMYKTKTHDDLDYHIMGSHGE